MRVMIAKNTNGNGLDHLATAGKPSEISAAQIQWVKLPKLCPLARTRLGNTSLMYTQITAPCENAKNAMYTTRSQISKSVCLAVLKIPATPARHADVPTAPIKSNFFRPNLSITDIASIVKTKFVTPTSTACRLLETLLN